VSEDYFTRPLAARLAELDLRASRCIQGESFLRFPRSLHPLPVLGIPGWCNDNEQAGYYDDVRQFRRGRRARHG
jgi:hypothetical protein